MKLKGLNLKGISLRPAFQKELQPCLHKYGTDATVTYTTDQIRDDYAGKEILGFKYNFNLHAFITPFYNDQNLLEEIYDTGLIGYGIYYQTEFWQNPVTKVVESIPDFYQTTWSQKSADSGLINQSQVGTTKTVNYPNHGQQLYDLTSGKYGYDVANSTAGQVDVLTPAVKYYHDWYLNKFGQTVSNASYGYGRRQPRYIIKDWFLAIRNSAKDNYWNYDFFHDLATDKPMSEGINYLTKDVGLSRTDAIAQCNDTLDKAIKAGGWYTDFSHWHTTLGTEYEEYLSSQRDVIGDRNVISLDYGTAVEYQFLRRMVRRIGLYTEGNELVIITDTKDFEGLRLNQIHTNLSVEVDLTGTILQGKEITGADIKKVATDKFIVEVPYTKRDGFNVIRLKETFTPSYLNFNPPTITASINDGKVIASTDQNTKVVVYTVPSDGILNQAVAVGRSSNLSASHEIEVGVQTGKDIYVGAITKEKRSALIKL